MRLALITNGAAEPQRAKVIRFALEHRFDHIQIEGEHGFGKPEERAYTHAMAALGVGPRETWMVGDNLEWEVVAPQRLGIHAIWHDGYRRRPAARLPDPPRPHHPRSANCCRSDLLRPASASRLVTAELESAADSRPRGRRLSRRIRRLARRLARDDRASPIASGRATRTTAGPPVLHARRNTQQNKKGNPPHPIPRNTS